jgi:cytochrome c biogenesis protein CcmG/thiol:disulfide interchange protein DsbE
MRRDWLKVAGLVAVALLIGQLAVRDGGGRLAPGTLAPPMTLTDLSGRTVQLSELRGKVVALNFWATWCRPCRVEIPDLAAVWQAHRERCFELIGVTEESGNRERVANAARDFGIPYPVVLDGDGSVARDYGVGSFPQTVLIDREGRVQRVFTGVVRQRTLEAAIRPLLGGGPPCQA